MTTVTTKPSSRFLSPSRALVASGALLLAACSAEEAPAEDAASGAPASSATSGSGDARLASDALANDRAEGITGCSGTYACVDYSLSGRKEQTMTLRVVDGECWAEQYHLRPDGKAPRAGVSDGYLDWHEIDGGFTLGGRRVEWSCSTTSGSSKSGPKRTAPHCAGSPTASCEGAKTEATCVGTPGCDWKSTSCQPGDVCRVRVDAPTCARMPGCTWKP